MIRLYSDERAELTLALVSTTTAERCKNRIRKGFLICEYNEIENPYGSIIPL
jgi:hypothetical protein